MSDRPPYSPEFDFVQAPDGAWHPVVTQPRCDFCLAPGPTWEFPAAPMEIHGHHIFEGTDDEWAACDECKELIEASRVGPMVERMVHEQPKHVPPGSIVNGYERYYPPVAVGRRVCRENLLRFMDARRGPPRAYTG